VVGALAAAALLVGCSAKTVPATNVTTNSAKLKAEVSWSQGEDVAYWWEYRRKNQDATWTGTGFVNPGPLGNSASNVPLEQPIANLSEGTVYEYRFCGFRTSPNPAGSFYNPICWNADGGANSGPYTSFTTQSSDPDGDGVVGSQDACPSQAASTPNGCPPIGGTGPIDAAANVGSTGGYDHSWRLGDNAADHPGRFDVVVIKDDSFGDATSEDLAALIARIKSNSPSTKVLLYKDIAYIADGRFTGNPNDYTCPPGGGGLYWPQQGAAVHHCQAAESWYLHAATAYSCNDGTRDAFTVQASERLRPCDENGLANAYANLANPSYVDQAMENIEDRVTDPDGDGNPANDVDADGIFLDDANISIQHNLGEDGPPNPNDSLGEDYFVAESELDSVDEWRVANYSLVADIRAALSSSKQVIANVGVPWDAVPTTWNDGWWAENQRTDAFAITEIGDVITLVEGYGTWADREPWETEVKFFEDLQGYGKAFPWMANWSEGAAERRLAYASFLMGWNGEAGAWFGAAAHDAPDADAEFFDSSWTAPSLDELGRPVESRAEIGNDTGRWRRYYEDGVALVNVGSGPTSFSLQGGSFEGSGVSCTGAAIEVPAGEARVLKRC
jgi:hypothetical protein